MVISLIPYTYHATVIKSAIRKKKNVVTFVIGWFGLDELLKTWLGRAMFHRLCLSLIRVWTPIDFHVPIEPMYWAQWLTMSKEAKEAGITVLNEIGLVTQSFSCLFCALRSLEE